MLIVKQLGYKIDSLQKQVAQHNTAQSLKLLIVLWSIAVIFVTLFLTDDNVLLLAGILLYEVLP